MDQLDQFLHTIYTGAITAEIGLGVSILNTILIAVMMAKNANREARNSGN